MLKLLKTRFEIDSQQLDWLTVDKLPTVGTLPIKAFDPAPVWIVPGDGKKFYLQSKFNLTSNAKY